MTRILTLVLIVVLAGIPVYAEMDMEAEKREAAPKTCPIRSSAASSKSSKDALRAMHIRLSLLYAAGKIFVSFPTGAFLDPLPRTRCIFSREW